MYMYGDGQFGRPFHPSYRSRRYALEQRRVLVPQLAQRARHGAPRARLVRAGPPQARLPKALHQEAPERVAAAQPLVRAHEALRVRHNDRAGESQQGVDVDGMAQGTLTVPGEEQVLVFGRYLRHGFLLGPAVGCRLAVAYEVRLAGGMKRSAGRV